MKIFNNGYLGSHNDEERSEMRYAMRIAESASHQIFERSPRLEDILRAYMFQCVRLTSNIVMRLKLAFLVKNDS